MVLLMIHDFNQVVFVDYFIERKKWIQIKQEKEVKNNVNLDKKYTWLKAHLTYFNPLCNNIWACSLFVWFPSFTVTQFANKYHVFHATIVFPESKAIIFTLPPSIFPSFVFPLSDAWQMGTSQTLGRSTQGTHWLCSF